MSIQMTKDMISSESLILSMKPKEPSSLEQRGHDNCRCVCYRSPVLGQPSYSCAVKNYLQQQELWVHLQFFNDQNQKLQIGNDQLKSKVSELTNKLSISNQILLEKKIVDLENDLQTQAGFFEDEKVKLPSRVLEKQLSDLTHELDNKKTIFFSKEKRFLKIIENLQSYSSSLEEDLSKKTTLFSTIKSNVSKISVSDLNDSINKQMEKIENRIESFKSKSRDTVLEEKMQHSSGSKPNKVFTNSSSSNHPKVYVPKKVYPSKSSKPFTKKVSQFTNYSLQKDKKYSKKPQSNGTFTSSSFLSFDDKSLFISNAKNQMKNREWNHKPNLSSSSTQTKSFSYTFKKLFELAPRPVGHFMQKVNDFVLKNPPTFKTPLSFKSSMKTKDFSSLRPRKLFPNETSCFKPKWSANSVHQIDETYIWFAKESKTIGPVLKWVPKVVSK